MNLKLDQPIRMLEISHGYFSDAYIRARLEGQPIRHAPVAVPSPDMRPRVDWRTGERLDPAQELSQ